jgi:putative tryptophan/tyrosine transport system substrate-binding protein
MEFNISTHKRLIAVLIALCVWANPLLAEKVAHVLIVTNSNDRAYQETAAGFKDQISAQGKVKFTELTLEAATSPAAKKIGDIKPDLIYTLGNESTKWAGLQTSRIPIVATMVLKDDIFRQSPNMTGVRLSHPLKTQFQWLRIFFPQQKLVAILYNPAENAATIQEARQTGQQSGFELLAIPVAAAKNLPYALERIASNVEILLAIPDETVMSVNTAKAVLLASFGNKVPLVGLSDNWVKSGAFYALSWDYDDLGKQCAVQAAKILAGSPVQTVSPEHPRKVAYTINAKIAEHMNIEIPGDLLTNAKTVFN